MKIGIIGAGGMVRRLFGTDGLVDTAIDKAALYRQIDGQSIDQSLPAEPDPEMGRTFSAANFIEAVQGKTAPLNHPHQSLILMRILDAAYLSAASGKSVAII